MGKQIKGRLKWMNLNEQAKIRTQLNIFPDKISK